MCVGLCALIASPVFAEEAISPKPASAIPADVAEVLKRSCIDCHSAEEPSGGVDLSQATTTDDIYHQGRIWNKAVRVLRDHTMPPKSEPALEDAQRTLLADWIEQSIRSVDCSAEREPGRVTIRRLNRVEYQNTLHDLFGIPVEAATDLPSDPAGNGFDNQGDTLFIPPVLMEKYLDTTKRMLDECWTNSVFRERIVPAAPSEGKSVGDAARENLATFLPRAFRRPVEESEIAARQALVESALARGETFDAGMRLAVESVLLSPFFLFRIEQNQGAEGSDEPYPITDHELATRLSYFLWSTMPDQELIDFADRGKLREPEVLRVQVERMLADPKSIALAHDFFAQWFDFRGMRLHEMDIRRYGAFNGLREDMYAESVAFFDGMVRQNESVLDILDAPYAYLNEKLANHYGVPDVKGGEIRRVSLPDRRRGGVLGMGSTLVITSYPTRTSPVLRGKWVLEQILGTPPPPPPPNVEPVSRDDTIGDGMTLRQRLEKHRQIESCASCHAKMDPIGFGLENFDGIGGWRDKDNDLPIDNAATLPDGTNVSGPEGLKDALLARRELFLRHMVEKMMVYALGRGLEYHDECAVRSALDRLAENEYRFHSLVHAVVESYPFQHRRHSR